MSTPRILSRKQIEDRVRKFGWAADALETIKKSAYTYKNREWAAPAPIPLSGWYHLYVCSKCATNLTWKLDSPDAHHCENCGNVETGPAYDETWVTNLNSTQLASAAAMTILDQAGKLDNGCRRAVDLLCTYAEAYDSYHEHGIAAGTGKMMPQGLTEATWMLKAAELYRRLIEDDAIKQKEEDLILSKLFQPAISILLRQTARVHNIDTWIAAGCVSLGLLTGDTAAVNTGKRIIAMNLEQGILPGGLWFEVSPGYHFYTIMAFLAYEQAMVFHGLKGGAADGLRAMLEVPLQMLMADGTIPAINDGSRVNPIQARGSVYEVADGIIGGMDTMIQRIVEAGYERHNINALIYGPDLPAEEPFQSRQFTIIDGLAVMHKDRMEALVKASRFGSGHDHPERLTLNLYLPGSSVQAADPGNPVYGAPVHNEFFKRTIAHNTIMVDNIDQECDIPVSIGRTASAAIAHKCNAQAWLAPGVNACRSSVVGDGWCLDWVKLTSDKEHLYQWLFHATGILQNEDNTPVSGSPCSIIDNPHVTDQIEIAQGSFNGNWQGHNGDQLNIKLQAFAEEGHIRIVRIVSPGLPLTEKREGLVLEYPGHELEVIALFTRGDLDFPVEIVERKADGITIRVDGTDYWSGHKGDLIPVEAMY